MEKIKEALKQSLEKSLISKNDEEVNDESLSVKDTINTINCLKGIEELSLEKEKVNIEKARIALEKKKLSLQDKLENEKLTLQDKLENEKLSLEKEKLNIEKVRIELQKEIEDAKERNNKIIERNKLIMSSIPVLAICVVNLIVLKTANNQFKMSLFAEVNEGILTSSSAKEANKFCKNLLKVK